MTKLLSCQLLRVIMLSLLVNLLALPLVIVLVASVVPIRINNIVNFCCWKKARVGYGSILDSLLKTVIS